MKTLKKTKQMKLPAYKAGHLKSKDKGTYFPLIPLVRMPFIPVHSTGYSDHDFIKKSNL